MSATKSRPKRTMVRPGTAFTHRPDCLVVKALTGNDKAKGFKEATRVLLEYPNGERRFHAGPASKKDKSRRAVAVAG